MTIDESGINVLKYLISCAEHNNDTYVDYVPLVILKASLDALKRPQYQRGHWVETTRSASSWFHPDYSHPYLEYICSACQKGNNDPTPFCPHCGAEMKGE